MPRRWGLGVLVLRIAACAYVTWRDAVPARSAWVCLPIDSNVAPVVPSADVSNLQGLEKTQPTASSVGQCANCQPTQQIRCPFDLPRFHLGALH
jgi:hypothetical protein